MNWTLPITVATLLLSSSLAVAHDKQPAPSQGGDQKTWSFSWGMARGKLGVHLTSMTEELRRYFGAPDDAGVLVSRVEPKSAAAAAGVRVGDVIYKVDSVRVDSPADVLGELGGKRRGDTVQLSIVRQQRRIRLTAQVKEEATGPFDLHLFPGPGEQLFEHPWEWHKRWEFKLPQKPERLDRDRRLEERMRRLERQLDELKKRMQEQRRKQPKQRTGGRATQTRI